MTDRFSFSEAQSGKCSSISNAATCTGTERNGEARRLR
jgi:hypothetical protein